MRKFLAKERHQKWKTEKKEPMMELEKECSHKQVSGLNDFRNHQMYSC